MQASQIELQAQGCLITQHTFLKSPDFNNINNIFLKH